MCADCESGDNGAADAWHEYQQKERDMSKASSVFKEIGANFVTDEAISYGWVNDDLAYEIARGRGIWGEELWAVSVRSKANPRVSHDASQMVLDRAAADEYVELLKEEHN